MSNEIRLLGFLVRGEDPVAALKEVHSLGFSTCQMYAPPKEWWSPANIRKIRKTMRDTKISVTALVAHFSGEDWTNIETIKRTIGFLNPETREDRIKKIMGISDFAQKIEVPVLNGHVGFIPEDEQCPHYRELVHVIQRIADYCHTHGQEFALETGQETAFVLDRFLRRVNRLNVGINFDPANLLLYNREDPIEALLVLRRYVLGVHCKDGKRPTKKGELGKEYPLGDGELNVKKFMDTLKKIEYTGAWTIETEIPKQRTRNILKAKAILEQLR